MACTHLHCGEAEEVDRQGALRDAMLLMYVAQEQRDDVHGIAWHAT
jgi:hypothetical protein